MKISIYLHKEIHDLLCCYGNLSNVVDDILDAGRCGHFDLENCPACQSREGASRYEVNVSNAYYLDLLSTYPANSPRVSLRRIIYFFVDNELYNELGWTPIRKYIDVKNEKNKKLIDDAKEKINRIMTANKKAIPMCEQILCLIDELRRYLL